MRTSAALCLAALVVAPGLTDQAYAASPPAAATPAAVTPAASKTPTPTSSTPTLPALRQVVAPEASIGGPRLAPMTVVYSPSAGVPAPPAPTELSWVLADLDTGEVVAAKAAHARLRPASTIKTLLALVVIPSLDATRVVTVTDADARADGTRVGLVPGQKYTVGMLLQALIMSSGNDAAYTLARVAGGEQGMAGTVAAMNDKARELGAHDTVVKDPSGLDAPGQVSSAYDLALIGRAAMQLPAFRTYAVTKDVALPGGPIPRATKSQSTKTRTASARATPTTSTPAAPTTGIRAGRVAFHIQNHNKLLYNYPGTIGVKNGYTTAAKRTYVSAVHRGGKTYLLSEMYGPAVTWHDQARLYDWAFRYGPSLAPVGQLVAPGEVTTSPTAPSRPAPTQPSAAPSSTRALAPRSSPPAPAASTPAVSLERPLDTRTAAVGAAGLGALALVAGALTLRRDRREH